MRRWPTCRCKILAQAQARPLRRSAAAVRPAARSTSLRDAAARTSCARISRARSPAERRAGAVMRFKRLLAESEGGLHAVSATAADWLRDGFGARAGFAALVAEAESQRKLI